LALNASESPIHAALKLIESFGRSARVRVHGRPQILLPYFESLLPRLEPLLRGFEALLRSFKPLLPRFETLQATEDFV
jgi:hypothetical protein